MRSKLGLFLGALALVGAVAVAQGFDASRALLENEKIP